MKVVSLDSVRGRRRLHHRGRRRGRVAEPRPDGVADRHAARPAGADGVGVHGPAHATRAAGPTRRDTRSPGWTRTQFVAVCCAKPAIHRFPAVMGRRIHGMCVVLADRYGGRPEQLWATAGDRRRAVRPAARAPRLRRGEVTDLRGVAREALRRATAGLGAGGGRVRRRRAAHDRRLPRPGVAGAVREWKRSPARRRRRTSRAGELAQRRRLTFGRRRSTPDTSAPVRRPAPAAQRLARARPRG